MQIGFNLPISGPMSSSENLARIAQHGDQLLADYGEQSLQHRGGSLQSSRLCSRRQVRPKNSAPTASMNSMLGTSTAHTSPARNTVCSETFM